MTDDKRFPRSVFSTGDEPDARFSLANERTFLAWLRTGLALLAGGVALEALGLGIHHGFRLAASLLLLVAGAAVPIQAWYGWKRTESALRHGTPLPAAPLTVVLTIVITAVGVLVLVGVLVR
jgi:putative membrane protein